MDKYRLVFFGRPFIKYMRVKSYSHFGVSKDYIKQSWTGPNAFKKFNESDKLFFKEYPEIRHLWQDWRKERNALHKMGFDSGVLLNRETNEQYTFNSNVDVLNQPWIEYKHYPEWEGDDVEDALMASAQILADTGKTIDFFWSGGIDSTAALIALNEVCPKQLHVIIGHSTEYQDYYDKVVKHLDHTINTTHNVFKEASPDKNILCPCGTADEVFGSNGHGKSANLYVTSPQHIYDTWEVKRKYKWCVGSLRYMYEWEGDKMDMSNHLPIYVQPPMEKWAVNQHRKGWREACGTIFGNMDENNPDTFICVNDMKDEHYLSFKMPLRNFIYKHTKDKEYSYSHGKVVSLVRGQDLLNRVEDRTDYRIWGILDDGSILTKDNIEQYDWRGFLQHYKEEWN
jgi:hypothetical protein